MSFRYLGNKTKLTDWIVGEIERVVPPGASQLFMQDLVY